MEKVCSKCKEELDVSEFYKDKRAKDGLYSSCKKCQREYGKNNYEKYVKEYQKNNRELLNRWYRKYFSKEDKNKLKKCRAKLFWAIKSNKITRGECEVCGQKNTEAHHPDYDKPLDVIWLCKKHHTLIHLINN